MADNTSACTQLFSIFELLEAVLLQEDDLFTLLLAQRVNKTFRETIYRSILLQEKLWMRPRPGSDRADCKCDNRASSECCHEAYNPFFFEFEEPRRRINIGLRKYKDGRFRINIKHRAVGVLENGDDVWREHATDDTAGSWRRMLVKQSKTEGHTLCKVAYPVSTGVLEHRIVHLLDWPTLGELIDAAVAGVDFPERFRNYAIIRIVAQPPDSLDDSRRLNCPECARRQRFILERDRRRSSGDQTECVSGDSTRMLMLSEG